jgi:hypothetical protein
MRNCIAAICWANESVGGSDGWADWSPKINPRTKHIAVKYHHFRESVGEDKGVSIVKIDTKEQKADIFTKGLPRETHEYIRKLLMGW